MAAANKFQSWVEFMAEGANVGSDQFAIALTNTAPVATNSVIADITQISYTNLSSRLVTTTSATQTSGTLNVVFANLTLTASGSVGPLRYVVLFDDTLASDPLVMWWDYGSSFTMSNGETLLINFTGSTIAIN